MGLLDKLLFWRTDDDQSDFDIDGCFTIPGAELNGDDACAGSSPTDDPASDLS